MIALPKPAQLGAIKKKCLCLGREKERGTHIQCSGFSWGCLRNWFLSHLTQSSDGDTAYFGCLGVTKTKESSGVCGSTRETTVPQIDARRSKLLQDSEKGPNIHL